MTISKEVNAILALFRKSVLTDKQIPIREYTHRNMFFLLFLSPTRYSFRHSASLRATSLPEGGFHRPSFSAGARLRYANRFRAVNPCTKNYLSPRHPVGEPIFGVVPNGATTRENGGHSVRYATCGQSRTPVPTVACGRKPFPPKSFWGSGVFFQKDPSAPFHTQKADPCNTRVGFFYPFSILQAMDGRGDAAAAGDEFRAGIGIERDDGRVA